MKLRSVIIGLLIGAIPATATFFILDASLGTWQSPSVAEVVSREHQASSQSTTTAPIINADGTVSVAVATTYQRERWLLVCSVDDFPVVIEVSPTLWAQSEPGREVYAACCLGKFTGRIVNWRCE